MDIDQDDKKSKKKLPKELEKQRTRVIIKPDTPKNTTTIEHHDAYSSLGIDNSFDIDNFKENFKIEIQKMDDEEILFDMVGVDPAIANALRRIMIAEVPTVAIENVYINENTSVIQDEVLAHRLGLIPIKVDPTKMRERAEKPGVDLSDDETLRFNLNITCKRKPNAGPADSEDIKYENSRVLSGHLVWEAQGEQEEFLGKDVKPVSSEILIAKLRPGQTINLVCFCFKGIGKDHAKFSPVATASYRLLPEIVLKTPVQGELAKELKAKCPMNVFDIEDDFITVARPRECSMCRECIREPEWEKRVELRRVKDHYIFSVESAGMYPAKVIFEEAIKILLAKIANLKQEITKGGKTAKQAQQKVDKMDV